MSFSNMSCGYVKSLIAVLTCCVVNGVNADPILSKGKELPYDIYLSGTFTSWVQDEKTKFNFDKNSGLYIANNLKAGTTSTDNQRRFKITGNGWNNQFGMVENKPEINKDHSSLKFSDSVATTSLQHFADMKDIYVSLSGDKDASSDEELLDFYLQIQSVGERPKATLKVVRDLPPLGKTFDLKSVSGLEASISYKGDGIYSVGVVLPKGVSKFILNSSS